MSRSSARPEQDREAWGWRRARSPGTLDRLILGAIVACGAVAIARFFDFWFRGEHVANPILYALLSLAVWYGISRIALGWLALLSLRVPEHIAAPPGHSVAIFTTSSPGEPLEMFERTLAACRRVRYPHTTYLLDDTRDPAFAALAAREGAVHLELVGLPGAKAGKINAALARSHEEFVLVLDPDHVPFPEFLDRVLGHFQDPKVGFVQVCQAYYNQRRSRVAQGAAEQTYGFYGPTEMGLYGLGAVLAIGANCTFRRSALESIGGHGVGLAEDLVTTVRLHAAGHRGVYVPEILSRGLVPEDLRSFLHQQLKWARGVYEVLFDEIPRHWRALGPMQRLSFSAVGTYYLTGVCTLVYALVPHFSVWFGAPAVQMSLAEFLVRGLPVVACALAAHCYAQRFYCQARTEAGLHLTGMVLKVASFAVYCRGFVLALGDRFLRYVPTAKRSTASRALPLVWPHLALVAMTLVSSAVVVWRALRGDVAPSDVAMLAFSALSSATIGLGLLLAPWRATPKSGDAWEEVPE